MCNAIEGWLRAVEDGAEFAHPTMAMFLTFLHREQS